MNLEDVRIALEKAVAEAVRKRLTGEPAQLEINRVQFLSARQISLSGRPTPAQRGEEAA